MRYTKHGQVGTYLYRIYNRIVDKCNNKNSRAYKDYGGRGIIFYKEWSDDNTEFFSYIIANIGHRPTPQHSIDRINNDKGYEPGNLKWSTKQELANNRRNNNIIEFHGELKTFKQWTVVLGMPWATLWSRLYVMKWTIEKSFTKPVRHKSTPAMRRYSGCI